MEETSWSTELKQGEVLVRTLYLSVDPYMVQTDLLLIMTLIKCVNGFWYKSGSFKQSITGHQNIIYELCKNKCIYNIKTDMLIFMYTHEGTLLGTLLISDSLSSSSSSYWHEFHKKHSFEILVNADIISSCNFCRLFRFIVRAVNLSFCQIPKEFHWIHIWRMKSFNSLLSFVRLV